MRLLNNCQRNQRADSAGPRCVAVGTMERRKKVTFRGRPALAKILDGFYAGFSDVSLSIYVRNPPFWCPALVLFWAPFRSKTTSP